MAAGVTQHRAQYVRRSIHLRMHVSPESSSYNTAPKLKISERASSVFPCTCSGDIYGAVPTTVTFARSGHVSVVTTFAMPKSSSFARPSVVTRTFAGFRSRCRRPRLCAASRALATCSASRRHRQQEAARREAPFDVLEHDVARADVVNLTDVRMVQRGDRTRFLLEPANPVSVGGKGWWKHLDGDITLEAHIARLPHFAHTAGTKTRSDFIWTDTGAGADRHSSHYLPEHGAPRRKAGRCTIVQSRPSRDFVTLCNLVRS